MRAGRVAMVAVSTVSLALAGCGSSVVPPVAPTSGRPSATPGRTSNPTSEPSIAPSPSSSPEPDAFRIVGYVYDVEPAIAPDRLDLVTHINYAFITPEEDGTFNDILNHGRLRSLVEESHRRGVKVLISVGGWGWDGQFETLAADPVTRDRLVGGIHAFVEEYELDGADIDWEYPDVGGSARDYLALMGSLREVLPAGESLLTTAVVASGSQGDGIDPSVFDLVDFINVMAYDGPGENHSSFEYAEEALDYWGGRGVPADQLVLGVPFYSGPSDVPYRDLVQADPAAPGSDEIELYGVVEHYNGVATMERKTRLAMDRASGVMIWTLAHDTTDDATSLLATIRRTADGG